VTQKAEMQITADASQFNSTMSGLQSKTQLAQAKIEKTATAVSGLGSAFSSLQGPAGAAIGAASNMAAAFATGGPLVLAMVGVGVAVSKVIAHFDALKVAAEESAKWARENADDFNEVEKKILAIGTAATIETKAHPAVTQLRDVIDGMNKGIDDQSRKVEKLTWTYAELRRERRKNYKLFVGMDPSEGSIGEVETARKELEQEQAKLDLMRAQQAQAERRAEQQIALIEEFEARKTVVDEKDATRAEVRKDNDAAAAETARRVLSDLDFEATIRAALEKSKAEARALEEEGLREQSEMLRQQHEERRAMLEELEEQKKRMHEEEVRRARETATQAVNYSVDAATFLADTLVNFAVLEAQLNDARSANNHELVNELEEKERKLIEDTTVAALQKIASIAMAEGTVMAIKGAAELAGGDKAKGIAFLAGGAALIGAAIAGFAGATGIGAMAAAKSATTDMEPPDSLKTEGISSFDVGSRTGDSRQTTVYNFFGPAFGLAEDNSARAINRLAQRGARLDGTMTSGNRPVGRP